MLCNDLDGNSTLVGIMVKMDLYILGRDKVKPLVRRIQPVIRLVPV